MINTCSYSKKKKKKTLLLIKRNTTCPTLLNPMDYSLPGSSVHGIYQARTLEWVAISFSRGSSWPRDQTQVSCIASRRFTIWATSDLDTYSLKSYIFQTLGEEGSHFTDKEKQNPAYTVRMKAQFFWAHLPCLLSLCYHRTKVYAKSTIPYYQFWNPTSSESTQLILRRKRDLDYHEAIYSIYPHWLECN